jgi:hypothetical protein
MGFIGVLISDQPAMESNISYYQRLLAMDQAEAAEIVEEHLKVHPREQIFDAVLLPALKYARRDRELGRLTENGEQFVLRATREILEDFTNLMPSSESETRDSPAADEVPAPLPKVSILGCPARDEADELALLMLRQLFVSTRYDVEVMSDAVLTSEVVGMIGAKNPAVIVIVSLSPGGLAQTRYLCKRLRARVPNLKIAIGQWGMESEDGNRTLLTEADRLGTTMIETREQIIQLSQSNPHPSTPPATPIVPFAPHNPTSPAEVVA